MYKSEKKARKDVNYELLKNEDLEEVDDENTIDSPLKVGGSEEKD